MKILAKAMTILVLGATFVGCAVQQPISLSQDFYQQKAGKKIGILVTAEPKAATSYTGNIGLLDYAIIAGVNSGLDEYLATLKFPEYEEFVNGLKTPLEQKGFQVVMIDKKLTRKQAQALKQPKDNKSKDNFSKVKKQHNLDYLVLLNFNGIGTTRSYYGFVPTSEPMAATSFTGQIIDLHTNELRWFSNINPTKPIPAPWDEPDAGYPNLTNAIYQSLNDSFEVIKAEILRPANAMQSASR